MTAEIKSQVSAEEWQLRVDLAAAYRLVALFGWDDLVFTHISARVPGADNHFLIRHHGKRHSVPFLKEGNFILAVARPDSKQHNPALLG